MKKLLLTNSDEAFELLGEYAGLYGDNGGDPDGNAWLPSDQDDIPAEIAQGVVDAGYGQMVDVLMSTDEGMIHHFHLPVILESLDKGEEEEAFERLQDLANEQLQWAHYGAYGASDSHWVFIKQQEG
jgi:hypothetical protein